jgi:hypothetical protein
MLIDFSICFSLLLLFAFYFSQTNNAAVYYRIKVTGKNGNYKYSNIIVLRNSETEKDNVLLFPNPSHGELWLSFNAPINEMAEVCIWNAQGKQITNSKLQMAAGQNQVKLPDLSGKPVGLYFLLIKTTKGIITRKFLIVK